MMQGDSFKLPIVLKMNNTYIDIATVSKVEICVGTVTKSYPDTVTYDSSTHAFQFPIDQSESFLFKCPQPVQSRVKFVGGDVLGVQSAEPIDVAKSLSKVVL